MSLLPDDERSVRKLFHQLSHKSEKGKTGGRSGLFGVPIVAKKEFVKYFSECKQMAKKIYDWMVQTCPEGVLDEETFVTCFEILLLTSNQQSQTSFLSQKYQKMDKTEILAWAYFELWQDPEHDMDVEISYTESWKFLKAVLAMLTPEDFVESKSKHTFEMTIRVMSDTVFAHAESTQMGISKFIKLLRSDFPHLNNLIHTYFVSKCLLRSELEHPKIEGEPMLLNLDIYMLLYISSPQLQGTKKMRRIFHSPSHGLNFEGISSALKHYDAPYVVMLKCLERSNDVSTKMSMGASQSNEYVPRIKDDTDTGVYSLIGGYFAPTQQKYETTLGKSNSIGVFSLLPRLRMLYPKTSSPQMNVVLSGYGKKGLGLGGKTSDDCRLWIDSDITGGSYVDGCTEDVSYSNGHVLGPKKQKINIKEVEIWGLGSDEDWENKLRRTHLPEEVPAPRASYYAPPVVFEEKHFSKSLVTSKASREKTSAPPRQKRTTEITNVKFDDDIERIVRKYQHDEFVSTAKVEVQVKDVHEHVNENIQTHVHREEPIVVIEHHHGEHHD